MPNIVFRFPGGRYHATPWGHHVNEGLVEWPPSPWRIVRALVATGYTKLGWVEPPPAARALVDGLAGALPEYRLPSGIATHTRHWMPINGKSPAKILDAYARVDRNAPLAVTWPSTLSDEATALLGELVPRLSYLGRAESIVDAKLVADRELPDGILASPGDVGRPGDEPVALFAPITAAEYERWIAHAAPPSGNGPPKRRAKTQSSPFPPDAFAALIADTSFLQEHGWTQPPGARRVHYYRPPLETAPRRIAVAIAIRKPQPADTAVFALASDTRVKEVLPHLSRALPQCELLHMALVAQLGEAPCPELTGRDATTGTPLDGHRHATLVPLDLDEDGHLDHVLVHAPMGFGPEAQRAVRAVRATYTKGAASALFVTLVGLGVREDFVSLGGQAVPELAKALSWESRTPFVPARHMKTKKHTLEDQLQAELAWRRLPRASRIEVLPRAEVVDRAFHRYVRARRDPRKRPPAPRFFGVRLELEAAVRGPIALGYASHFGLGLFAAAAP